MLRFPTSTTTMRKLTFAATVALVFLLSGCVAAPNSASNGDSEPNHAALAEAIQADTLAHSRNRPYHQLELIDVAPWGADHVAVFSATQAQPDGTTSPLVGYALAREHAGTWTIESLSSVGGFPPPTVVMYGSDTIGNNGIVYGRVLAANVATIEATFDTLQTVRSDVRGTGFAIVGAGAKELQSLRVLDSTGQTLRLYHLDDVSNLSEEQQ